MSGFTDSALEKKLCELNQSQQSIQTLSLWLIHHRKHHKAIVQVWIRELNKAKINRKLTFMYLANDVIQNSKKKGPEFSKEFSNVLSKAFAHVFECVSDDKTKKGLERIISVWEDRNVYDSKIISGLRAAMKTAHRSSKTEKKSEKSETPSPSKKSRPQEVKSPKKSRSEKTKKRKATGERPKKKDSPKSPKRRSIPAPPKEEVAAPASPHGDPPEAEELIRAIQDLDNSPSTDAVVREKIAQFPPEVSDVTLLDKIQSRACGERLRGQVEDASGVLTEYNLRLHSELEDRRKLGKMLHDFTRAQRAQLQAAEKKLEEFRDQLQRVSLVRSELKSHLQNLPDLTLLPSVTGGLAPLPSAGDLFQ